MKFSLGSYIPLANRVGHYIGGPVECQFTHESMGLSDEKRAVLGGRLMVGYRRNRLIYEAFCLYANQSATGFSPSKLGRWIGKPLIP